jgi:Uma2 family endonuclease
MSTILIQPEQRVLLRNVRWETYEQLVDANQEKGAPRLTYDRGRLEIMSPSAEHEQFKEVITLLVNVIAEEKTLDIEGFGSTTFRREDLERGFEADACFYIGNAKQVRGKDNIDLSSDPPPELVIEVDITHSSVNKLSIFSEFGVSEVWQYDQKQLKIFILAENEYLESPASKVFPDLTPSIISHFIEESRKTDRPSWLRRLREWARA